MIDGDAIWLEIGLGVGLFTGIILVLVLVILLARSRLVASGAVSVMVNGERELAMSPGVKLMNGLADANLFVASACGGGGTCAQCQVKVLEGGGEILPTERTHINRRQAREGYRLSCQVAVKQDLKIEVPAEAFDTKKWTCKVKSNHNVATFIKEFVVKSEIIINASTHETRIAILEDDSLVEIWVERPESERMVGDIYKGRINAVLPGMQVKLEFRRIRREGLSEEVPPTARLEEALLVAAEGVVQQAGLELLSVGCEGGGPGLGQRAGGRSHRTPGNGRRRHKATVISK